MPKPRIYSQKLKAIDRINHSNLAPLWKVLLIELICRQNTQPDNENGGLSWPGLDRLAEVAGQGTSPEQLKATLQQLEAAGLIQAHGTTTGGVTRWSLHLGQLDSDFPLLSVWFTARMREVDGLAPATRSVLEQLLRLARIDLRETSDVTVSCRYGDPKDPNPDHSWMISMLPWLSERQWQYAIRQLNERGLLVERQRGNRHHPTEWQIMAPPPAGEPHNSEKAESPARAALPAGPDTPTGGSSSAPPSELGGSSSAPPSELGGSSSAPPSELGGSSSAPPSELGGSSSAPPSELDGSHPYRKLLNEVTQYEIQQLTNDETHATDELHTPAAEGLVVEVETGTVSSFVEALADEWDDDHDRDDYYWLPSMETDSGVVWHPGWAWWCVDKARELRADRGVDRPPGALRWRIGQMLEAGHDFSEPPSGWAQVEEARRRESEWRETRVEDLSGPQVGDAGEIWTQVLALVEKQITRPNFQTWLKDTRGLSYTEDVLVAGTQSSYASDMIEQNLYYIVLDALTEVIGREIDVQFVDGAKWGGAA